MLTVAVAAAAIAIALALHLRKIIQGYYWDRSFTPSRDLHGCVAVVTGANSGLGKATSQELASYGVKVIMACRSTRRGEEAMRYIKARVIGADLEVWQLDVSSISSIDSFTTALTKQFPKLDFLVNNAGVGWLPSEAPLTCKDTGVCTLFQTNFVGPARLTLSLLPLLKAAASSGGHARVVSVSSGAHTRATVGRCLEDINEHSDALLGGKYGQSKLAQIMWTKELQRRVNTERGAVQGGGDLRCVAVTPGFVRTPAFFSALQGLHLLPRIAAFLLTPFIFIISRSMHTGAQVIVMGCAGEVKGGAYYSNCLEKPSSGKHNISNDPLRCAELWKLTEELLEKGM
mmetsp:Transcript_19165/g.53448  ORF Transcript_19165/g.53448 Transcript_19165/m.53448 type:complete len:344 (+) Transcript_19165:72-1103(+)|eukprot:CAMPEP_0117664598 /NCGR_PEP_ID=MMETSP0804-20121206/9314_1 /TAXON_ID=1074897 /ORGANISM="Tetraselmis astigmatica, Strain CCMP880" /LENGTH=343 /DNA_ID=CAMNT_0005471859 /DNA_START=55 /DNA_END=1086 /DNA_ORIENTATION=+